MPSVSGGKSAVSQIEAVAECLLDNLGRGISYKRLIAVIGRKSDNPSSRHLLRQYTSMLMEMLLKNDLPYIIAVAHDVGYVLCEITQNPRRTVDSVGSNGRSQIGRNVRQQRIAAGLTQTALAKRSRMNRSLNRMEAGHRTPTLDTLARVAKALHVPPRSLL